MKKNLIKVKNFIIKNLLGILIGFIIAGSISIATANYAFEGSNVYYNKSSSGGSYSNVQDSITELYGKAKSAKKILNLNGVELTPSSNCNAFSLGSWKSMTNANGSCYFTYNLTNNVADNSLCIGELIGNYVEGSGENFRWGSGAPYAFVMTVSNTEAILESSTSANYSAVGWGCKVESGVLKVYFDGWKDNNGWSYASYGWQTRADRFRFTGYIIY